MAKNKNKNKNCMTRNRIKFPQQFSKNKKLIVTFTIFSNKNSEFKLFIFKKILKDR